MFTVVRDSIRIYLIIYVDDLLAACASEAEVQRVYESLRKHFKISWLGEAMNFLGLELQRESDGVYSLSVKSYIEKLDVKAGLEIAKVAKIQRISEE